MKKHIKMLIENEVIRYLFFGGCTTGVSLGAFFILRYGLKMKVLSANLISIILAVVFAFFVNKWFVFQSEKTDFKSTMAEFLNFTGMRMGTMMVELLGVEVLIRCGHVPDWGSKTVTQIAVIVLNYIISKFWVFRDRMTAGGVVNE